jgi:predicted O-methyltransferase YrrM
MDETGKELAAYIQRLFVHEDNALQRAREEARAEGLPGIEVSGEIGVLLGILARAVGARKILEVGTLGGYSGTWLARALAPGGKLITLEVNPRHAEVARHNFERADVGDRVTIRVGPALETLPDLRSEAPFDLIFIDADKGNYINYYEAVLPKLADGGLIAADNTLWSGNVIDANDTSTDTAAIRAFNDHVRGDPRVVCVQTTIRDGVTLIRRA